MNSIGCRSSFEPNSLSATYRPGPGRPGSGTPFGGMLGGFGFAGGFGALGIGDSFNSAGMLF